MLKILAIAAHPDDVELSCAGTIIKHTRMGDAVGILDLTEGELGTRGSVELRYKESAASAELMGVKVRVNAKMPDGFFQNDEPNQRKIITYLRQFRPEIVIAGALEDRHPDHRKAGRLIADACFLAGLRKVETTWEGVPQEPWRPKRIYHMIQDRHYEPDFIVDISETFEEKIKAVHCFGSQFYSPGSEEPLTYIASEGFLDTIIARDVVMGKRIGVRYGEGYTSENIPGVSSLNDLLLPALA